MKDDAERARDIDEQAMICVNDIHALATQLATGSIMPAMFRRKTFARLLAFAQQPEGWRLVPAEPTQAMKEAAVFAVRKIGVVCAGDVYSAMLDAAPIPGEE